MPITMLSDGDTAPDRRTSSARVAMPEPIGPLTERTNAVLRDPTSAMTVDDLVASDTAGLCDPDLQSSLFLLHQRHDRGVEGADPGAEWEPNVTSWWHRLATRFETLLISEVPRTDLALGPIVPLLGSVARRTSPVGRVRLARTCDDPMHRRELRRHPLAHVRAAAAAELAATRAPAIDIDRPPPTVEIESVDAATLLGCNLTWHLALRRRLLPALLGHLAWHEMTAPADPIAGPTHVAVADAYLTDRPDECGLAVWGAEASAHVEALLS